MLIEIEKIEVGERLRSRLDPVKLRQLADDMDRNGQLQEIIVSVNWETNSRGSTFVGKATLIAGYRRLEAAKLLGWKTIRCVWQFDGDVDPNNEIDRLRLEYSENELRENFTEMERVAYGVKIKERIAAEARERMLSGKRLNYEYDPETGYKVWREEDLETPSSLTTLCGDDKSRIDDTSYISADPVVNLPQGQAEPLLYIGGRTSEFAAKKVGMSGKKFRQGEYVLKHGSKEQHSAIDCGEASISGVYSELRPKSTKTTNNDDVYEADAVTDAPLRVTPLIESIDKVVNQTSIEAEPDTPKLLSDVSHKKTDPFLEKLRAEDAECVRKHQEFDALTSEGKIEELKRQLKEERARATRAESKLAHVTELRQNEMYHYNATIDMLKNQLKIADARITELEEKYESDKHTS